MKAPVVNLAIKRAEKHGAPFKLPQQDYGTAAYHLEQVERYARLLATIDGLLETVNKLIEEDNRRKDDAQI